MLENVKLSRKLIGSFILLALVAGSIGFFGVIQIKKLNKADVYLYEKATLPLELLIKINSGFERAAANISYCLLEENPDYLPIFDESVMEVETNLEKYKNTIFNAEGENKYKELVSQWEIYLKDQEAEKSLALDGKFEEGLALRSSEATKRRRDVRELLFEITAMNISEAKTVIENNARTATRASIMIYFAMIVGMLTAILIGISITRSINSPIQTVVKALRSLTEGSSEKIQIVEAIARGDLAKEVNITKRPDIETDTRRKDELGMLLVSVSDLCDVMISLEEGIGGMTVSLRKSKDQERDNDWMKSGVNDLNILVRGEKALDEMTNEVVSFLSTYLKVGVSALYLFNERENVLEIIANYAFTRRKNLNEKVRLGEGLAGEAARERKPICLSNIPPDYLAIGSALGEATPHAVLALPLVHDNRLIGVVEFGSFKDFSELELEFLKQAGEVLAISISVNLTRQQVNRLLEESRAQAEELQVQQEELQAANEELESQTQRLEESEEKLKAQQEELQVTNEELEEKNQLLERQKREVNLARQDIEEKAGELALASKYKSEFLANMSHELRTPLNSLLLLAQFLSQNKEGNLTEGQVEAAKVIHGSGGDLLNLINEILDLSKIEAGRMELQTGPVRLQDVASNVRSSFDHVAAEKGLALEVLVEDDAPGEIISDRKRMEQIIKNLVSNAIKFTETGSVSVTFGRPQATADLSRSGLKPQQSFSIKVKDTGIGIAPESQKVIFEAFQQADGTTSRKYGGTGLGLSISREVVKLLGGEIQLESEPGKGSTFTLFLPLTPRPREANIQQKARRIEPDKGKALTVGQGIQPYFPDDREQVESSDSVILVIEDDPSFSKVLFDKCHERGFKCVAAPTGEAGLELALKNPPTGIILDIRLPGMDGWTVLSALKENLRTRHVPVHVVSVETASTEALRKGAVGHAAKPLSLEELDEVFKKIKGTSEKNIKRVLIIEDDKQIRGNVVRLIEGGDVTVDEAETGKQAMDALRSGAYDCVVLDLGLPDVNGFDLLKRAESEGLALPPVVVHTASDLSVEQETNLREYAETIVLKDVLSQERLLDEVSLFLHRMVDDMPEKKRRIIKNLHDTDELLKDKKVLLVDDDMRTVFALSRLLSERGVNALKADNGEKALKALDQNPDVDLVLMDIMMPVMDGFEAMAKIRAQDRFRRLPIIALTAKAMKEDREKCIASGANDYMAKPLDQERLLSLMRVWLYR